jgi:hypothetical protein
MSVIRNSQEQKLRGPRCAAASIRSRHKAGRGYVADAGTTSVAIAVTVDTPVGGVTVGHRDHYRDYDSPRYRGYDSPRYRSYARSRGCRTVTITRDDGSFKRIQRCG